MGLGFKPDEAFEKLKEVGVSEECKECGGACEVFKHEVWINHATVLGIFAQVGKLEGVVRVQCKKCGHLRLFSTKSI